MKQGKVKVTVKPGITDYPTLHSLGETIYLSQCKFVQMHGRVQVSNALVGVYQLIFYLTSVSKQLVINAFLSRNITFMLYDFRVHQNKLKYLSLSLLFRLNLCKC